MKPLEIPGFLDTAFVNCYTSRPVEMVGVRPVSMTMRIGPDGRLSCTVEIVLTVPNLAEDIVRGLEGSE